VKNTTFRPLLRRGLLTAVMAVTAVAGVALTPSTVMAQPGGGGGGGRGGFGGGPGGGMGGRMGDMFAPALDRRLLDKFAPIVHLTDDQKQAAETLVEGYQEQIRQQREAMRTKMEEIREKARETGDNSGWEQMRTIGEKMREDRKQLDASIMSDLKSLLTPEQQDRWPAVERAVRREQGVRRGFISGERVNLFDLVDDAKLTPEQHQPLEPTLEAYDEQLDRALTARNAAQEEAFAQFREIMQGGNTDKAQELMNKGREASIRVRDINRKFARQVADMLPEDKKAAFEAAFARQSFPEVYRPTQAQRALEAAVGFADLTSDQKESIKALHETFSRTMGSLNEKMAAAQQAEEEKITVQGLMQRFQQRGGGRDEGPLGEIRKQRREAGDAAVENLKKILTPAQVERLPKGDGRGDGFGGPGGGGRGRGGDGGDAPAPRRNGRPGMQDPT
jgi:hypothetical protein